MKTNIISKPSAADLIAELNGQDNINVISVWSVMDSADKETFYAFVQYTQ